MTTRRIALTVNGERREVEADPDKPLPWVLRDDLRLTGAKCGCGAGLCGACTVHAGGQAVRSCVTPVGSVVAKPTRSTRTWPSAATARRARSWRRWRSSPRSPIPPRPMWRCRARAGTKATFRVPWKTPLPSSAKGNHTGHNEGRIGPDRCHCHHHLSRRVAPDACLSLNSITLSRPFGNTLNSSHAIGATTRNMRWASRSA